MKNSALRTLASLFLISLVSLFSCGGDEQDKKTITISVPESAIPLGTDIWFFITDDAGKLLDIQEAFRGFEVKFEIPAGKKVTLCKLSRVNTTTVTDFRVFAYTNVSPGEYSLSPIIPPEQVEGGFHYLQLSGMPGGYNPRAVGINVAGCTWSGIGTEFSIKTFLLANNVNLVYYVTGYNNHTLVPRYKVYSDASIEDSETLDFSAMTEASKITVNFDTQVDAAGVNISAPYSSSYLEIFGMTNVTSVPLYYPGDVFSTYRTRIDIVKDDNTYSYFTVGPIPATMKKIPVTINSFTADTENVSIGTTGTFDYLYAYSLAEWTTGTTEHYFDWIVYMDDETETFNIPAIPAEIMDRYPELSTIPAVGFNQLFFFESDEFTGYDAFIKKMLSPEVPSANPLTESVSLRKTFGAPGSKTHGKKRSPLPE